MKTDKIKLYRMQLGYSQTEFAEKVGISRNYLNMIENGKNQPSIQTLEKIAKAVNKTLKDFF